MFAISVNTSNDPDSLNAHLQAQHTDNDDIQEIIPPLTTEQAAPMSLTIPQPIHDTL